MNNIQRLLFSAKRGLEKLFLFSFLFNQEGGKTFGVEFFTGKKFLKLQNVVNRKRDNVSMRYEWKHYQFFKALYHSYHEKALSH